MNKLEELEQVIDDNDIDLIEFNKMNEKSMIIKDFENEYVTIVVNKIKIANERELLVLMSHKLGHYNTSGYYCAYMLKSNKCKMEYNANVDSVKRLVPIKKLKSLLIDSWGYSRNELAEEFGVTENFIDEAVHIYKRKGLLPQ